MIAANMSAGAYHEEERIGMGSAGPNTQFGSDEEVSKRDSIASLSPSSIPGHHMDPSSNMGHVSEQVSIIKDISCDLEEHYRSGYIDQSTGFGS